MHHAKEFNRASLLTKTVKLFVINQSVQNEYIELICYSNAGGLRCGTKKFLFYLRRPDLVVTRGFLAVETHSS